MANTFKCFLVKIVKKMVTIAADRVFAVGFGGSSYMNTYLKEKFCVVT